MEKWFWACNLLVCLHFYATMASNQEINQMTKSSYYGLDENGVTSSFGLAASTPSLQEPQMASVLLIGTIDGSLSAFSADGQGRPLWTLATSPGPLLSSSLSKFEVVREGIKIQLIPALNGALFSFNGHKIQQLPISAENLLSSSFKISDDSVITGGKEIKIYGLDLLTGKVKYICASDGCKADQQDVENEAEHNQGTLVVRRLSQTIRAFDIHQGNEKWNFSVGELDVTMATTNSPHSTMYLRDRPNCSRATINNHADVSFQFDVATGAVHAMSADASGELWRYQFSNAITSVWKVADGCVLPLDLVTSVPPFFDPAIAADHNTQLIYIGRFNDQLYIQHTSKLPHPPIAHKFPDVSFRPLLISAASRTPAIAAAYRPLVKFPSVSGLSLQEDKALVPLRPAEYPFDNGYFLVAEEDASRPVTTICLDSTLCASSDGSEEGILHRLIQHWIAFFCLFFLPVVLVGGMRLMRPRQMVLKALDGGIKRQNTTSSSTKSLTSVLSLQELGPKISRFRSDFEVLEQLGKGGFGVVYSAKNRLDDNIYAVKKIQLPRSDSAREKVRREVRVLAKLDHVGIVRFYNAWVETEDIESSTLSSTQATVLDHGNGTDRVGVSSSVSADLCSEWIGTSRQYTTPHFRSPLSDPENGNEESLDVLFQDDSKPQSEASVRAGMDRSMTDFSGNVFKRSRHPPQEDQVHTLATSQRCLEVDAHAWPHGNFSGSQGRKRFRSGSSKKSSPSLSGLSDLEDSLSSDSERNMELVDAVRPKPQLFIQMELCRKETLKDWLKVHNETRHRHHILDIFYQIVCSVEYLHSKSLMHRDLKPSNVLFAIDGTSVKVADFGLVTGTDDEEASCSILPDDMLSLHGHTNQVGTSLYMSPELVSGRSYCEKIDIYSLGLIFLELLTPFTTEMERIVCLTQAKKLQFHLYNRNGETTLGQGPLKPWTRTGDEEVLKRLLAFHPNERPTATSLRNDLDSLKIS